MACLMEGFRVGGKKGRRKGEVGEMGIVRYLPFGPQRRVPRVISGTRDTDFDTRYGTDDFRSMVSFLDTQHQRYPVLRTRYLVQYGVLYSAAQQYNADCPIRRECCGG